MAPNKTISCSKGVNLIDHGKLKRGDAYTQEGQYSLTEYRKLSNPHEQLVAQSQQALKLKLEKQNLLDASEDPYKAFKKQLLKQAKTGSRQR